MQDAFNEIVASRKQKKGNCKVNPNKTNLLNQSPASDEVKPSGGICTLPSP